MERFRAPVAPSLRPSRALPQRVRRLANRLAIARRKLGIAALALAFLLGAMPSREAHLPDARPRVGAAAVSIRVPEGVPLGGYPSRGAYHHATGVRHAAEARALVANAADGSARIAIVTLDILIITGDLRESILERTADLGFDALVVTATHTHSGPGGYLRGLVPQWMVLGAFNPESRRAIIEAAAEALAAASRSVQPAVFSLVSATAEGLNANRRGGPVDPTLSALLVDGPDGAIATLFSFAAHPTILDAANRAIDPDYPGAARLHIDRTRGGISLFLPGAIADHDPAHGGSNEFPHEVGAQCEAADRLGAGIAERLLAAPALASADLRIAYAQREWRLPPVDVDERCAAWIGAPFFNLAARDFFPVRTRLVSLRIGPLRLFASPYELSVGVASALRERDAGDGPLLIASHSNDWLGYLLQPEDYDRGGHEACLSGYGREAAQRVVDAAASVILELP